MRGDICVCMPSNYSLVFAGVFPVKNKHLAIAEVGMAASSCSIFPTTAALAIAKQQQHHSEIRFLSACIFAFITAVKLDY